MPSPDIPLHPIVGKKEDVQCNFKLHWLNNKDLEFTLEAEKLLQNLHQRLLVEEGAASMTSSANESDLEGDKGGSSLEEMSDSEEELRGGMYLH